MLLVQVEWLNGFLAENEVYVNGEVDQRRGRKLRDGDIINIPGVGRFQNIVNARRSKRMYIERLALTDYRNYESLDLEFSPQD